MRRQAGAWTVLWSLALLPVAGVCGYAAEPATPLKGPEADAKAAEPAAKDDAPRAPSEIVIRGRYAAPKLVSRDAPEVAKNGDTKKGAADKAAAKDAPPSDGMVWLPPPPAIGTLSMPGGVNVLLLPAGAATKGFLTPLDGKDIGVIGRWLVPNQTFEVEGVIGGSPPPGRGTRPGKGRNI